MELRHLKYFIAVAETENVTRAAARLHVAQPSLSRQIRDLEEELGVSLFDRSAKAVRLTEAGRHFLTEARDVMARIEQALQSIRDFADGNQNELHVGYAPSLTTRILPQTLREFQIECPRIKVNLHDLSTEEMLEGLRDRSLDAALIVKPSNPALNSLVFHEILRYRPCVAMPASHRLATMAEVTVKSLAEEALIAYSRVYYPEYYTWLDRIFSGAKFPRIISEYDSSTSLIASIEAGSGVAIVQEGFECLAGSRIVIRGLQGAEKRSFSFGIARHKDDVSKATLTLVATALATAPSKPH